MENTFKITEYFGLVETTEEHNGYFFSVGEALTLLVLGSMCGLESTKKIHQWATSDRVRDFLEKHFGIARIPSYYWLLCLLHLVDPISLNECFVSWAQSFMPRHRKFTLSFDGKTIRSTGKMRAYKQPLHIISAQIAELGMTFGQQATADKSNEIPAVRELVELLNIEGCIVVADALNCQKETAQAILDAGADYLLSVKDNQPTLKEGIEDYVKDDVLREGMDKHSTCEKGNGRIEKRVAYATDDVNWIYGKEEWPNLFCIGAINTKFTTEDGTTDEWHYYISSRKLSAKELLNHARLEWSVESMHWLLDVHFREDSCRVEDKNGQQNLNMVRKIVLNAIRAYKNDTGSKSAFSKVMFDCLLDPNEILNVLHHF